MTIARHEDPAVEIVPLSREAAEELTERICAHAARQARDSCELLILIGEFDAGNGWAWSNGFRSVAHWLAWTCSMTQATAREHVRVARALRRMPTVAAAFGAGELSYSKVREVTRIVDVVDEARLCRLARYATASQLARMISSFRAAAGSRIRAEARRQFRLISREEDSMTGLTGRLPAEEAAIVAAAVQRARDLNSTPPSTEVNRDDPDDHDATPPYTDADALLDVCRHYLATAVTEDESGEDRSLVIIEIAAEQLGTSSTELVEVPNQIAPGPLRQAQDGASTGSGQVRGSGLSTVDVPAGTDPTPRTELVEVPTPGPSTGSGQVIDSRLPPVDVPAGTDPTPRTELVEVPSQVGSGPLRQAQGGASVGAGQGIDTGRAPSPRAQVCMVRGAGPVEPQTAERLICTDSVLGAVIDQHGDVLALGRTRRLVSKRQRRALQLRDQICQYPGCWRDRHLQAHHRIPWSQGGPTDLANLILLCQFHHVAVHEGGMTIIRRGNTDFAGARTGDPGWQFLLPDGQPVAESGWRVMTADRLCRELCGHDLPDGRSIGTVGGGAGFILANCVEAIFGMIRHQDHDAA